MRTKQSFLLEHFVLVAIDTITAIHLQHVVFWLNDPKMSGGGWLKFQQSFELSRSLMLQGRVSRLSWRAPVKIFVTIPSLETTVARGNNSIGLCDICRWQRAAYDIDGRQQVTVLTCHLCLGSCWILTQHVFFRQENGIRILEFFDFLIFFWLSIFDFDQTWFFLFFLNLNAFFLSDKKE